MQHWEEDLGLEEMSSMLDSIQKSGEPGYSTGTGAGQLPSDDAFRTYVSQARARGGGP